MRFQRYGRFEAVTMTKRKAAAFARKQANEQARYPLFAEHVAAEQHGLDEEYARRAIHLAGFEAHMRAFHASMWRKARGRYFALDDTVRAAIRGKWGTWAGPCTASYFAALVDAMSGDQTARLTTIDMARQARQAALPPILDAPTTPLF